MITLFTIPKKFTGHIKIIQDNAIESWRRLPESQIILFGDEEGTEQTARRFCTHHVRNIKRNEFGTPLLDHTFRIADQLASSEILCYVNTDMILPGIFTNALMEIKRHKKRFLAVGRRWNANIDRPIDFNSPVWEQTARSKIIERGSDYGIDYFAFPKKIFAHIPPFAVGRAYWDNWMIYNARRRSIPVVDMSNAAHAIHQNHDYRHTTGGQKGAYEGREAQQNLCLAGGSRSRCSLRDASHYLSI